MAKKKKVATIINPQTGNAISLTPEVIEQAERLYRIGMQDNAICNYLGINPTLFKEWLVRGATFNNGIHGELFRRCAKAVSSCELELFADMRKHALGSPAEYAYDEIIHPDGRIEKKLSLDGEGKPIVKRQEIRGNPTWISWILEKRFRKTFGKQEELHLSVSTPDDGYFNAALNSKDDSKQSTDLSELTPEEQLKVVEAAAKAMRMRNVES